MYDYYTNKLMSPVSANVNVSWLPMAESKGNGSYVRSLFRTLSVTNDLWNILPRMPPGIVGNLLSIVVTSAITCRIFEVHFRVQLSYGSTIFCCRVSEITV